MNIRSISLAILVAASVSVVGLSAGIDVAQARSELSIGNGATKSSKTDKGGKTKSAKDSTKAGKSKGTKTTKGTKSTKDTKVKAHPDNQYQPGKKYGYKHGVGVLGRYNPGWQPGQFYK